MIEADVGALEIQDLSKRFGATVALKDVSLSAEPGELLAVVGPSGCGKTTLLRAIAGLERPDAGVISLGNVLVFNASPLRIVPANQRRIGMVFQNYALWPHMTVFQNVAYPLRVRGVGRVEKQRTVGTALALVRMADHESRYPHQLSGGEQQRIALARALVMQPRILLLDEPLSNLDAHLREEMGGEVRRIQRETGLTVLHVTHDQVEAMTLADRIVVMDRGRVMQVGRPQEVYRRPQNRFVAGFMGVSNLLRCAIAGQNRHRQAILPDGSALAVDHLFGAANGDGAPSEWPSEGDGTPSEWPSEGDGAPSEWPSEGDGAPSEWPSEGDSTLSIRPEDIVISREGEGIKCKIREVIYQGNLAHCRVSCGGAEFRVQAPPDCRFQVGEDARLRVRRATVVPETSV
jgi:ABC-type Fe3+/spermidine/putrescine transport system ATPase subunit